MLSWLRKFLKRDVTFVVTPLAIPPGYGVIFTLPDFVRPEDAERLRQAVTSSGFPECIVIAGVQKAEVWKIDSQGRPQ